MKTLRVRTWARFVAEIERFSQTYSEVPRTLTNGNTHVVKNTVLFRGQANASWKLTTTLERRAEMPFTIGRYIEKALSAKNELETYTGQRWSVPQGEELHNELTNESHKAFANLPGYEYLVYLRHHGYPSPLLDWTESPYIAAYFALSENTRKSSAIYCYVERPQGNKGGVVGQPIIHVRGPMITSHKRHFAQRAWYTTATSWDYKKEEHVFCPHESVFQRNSERQDVLLKIILSPSVRSEGLRKLDQYNINHFTLFQTEDSLVRALDHRHFDLSN